MARNIMQERLAAAAERNAEAEDRYTPAPRRPGPIAGTQRTNPLVTLLLALAGLGAVVALGFILAPPAPLALPPEAAPTSPWAATSPPAPAEQPVAPPTAVSAPAEAPAEAPAQGIGTGGYIEPVNVPQAAPVGVPVYVAPEPTPSDLVPVPTEPAGWHPPFSSGYSPTENYVEVRP